MNETGPLNPGDIVVFTDEFLLRHRKKIVGLGKYTEEEIDRGFEVERYRNDYGVETIDHVSIATGKERTRLRRNYKVILSIPQQKFLKFKDLCLK